jgi:pyruvate/2-oxoglutarate dehydrogenase complex dihydrolipoamide dehydrogenase (E3) component
MHEAQRAGSPNVAGTDGDTDVIVLGVGTAGEDLSLQLLDAGLDVVGIEAGLVGGECPYWACLPSKLMIRAAKALKEARWFDSVAGDADVTPNWEPVAEKVRWLTGGWDDAGAIKRYKDRGGHLVKGRGKLIGPRTVAVGDQRFTARRGIVIATGSEPFVPPIAGLDEVDIWDTHDVIAMEQIPASMIAVGGGSSGCELAQVASQFGCKVTIVEGQDRLLPKEEPEASKLLEAAFAAEGIEVRTGARVERVAKRNGAIVATLVGGEELTAERLFLATGRRIDLSDLGLESVGLDSQAPFIDVDAHMRAGDGIWAIGDVTGKAFLSLVGLYQSKIAVADILGKAHEPARYDAVPRVVFTDPEVGSVGMTEAEARKAGRDVAVVLKQLPATFSGMVHWLERGIIKVIVDRKTGTLVGATVAGRQTADILSLLNLAVHASIPLSQLRTMMYGFPALYSALGETLGGYGAHGVISVMDPDYRGLETLSQIGQA